MNDWMTIRVVLVSGRGMDLKPPPGRVMLVHADHAFAELAEAIDLAFARWDLAHLHLFEVEGHRLLPASGEPLETDEEDSDETTVGEVGLRAGTRFSYTFDLGDDWRHDCLVEDIGVDPYELLGEEPDDPVPVWGWGTIPDQYGRVSEQDDDEPAADWEDADVAAWRTVDDALDGVDREVDEAQVSAAVARLRASREAGWPYDELWASADPDDEMPADDRELWTQLAAGVVAAGPEDARNELEPADWAGAVIELVRADIGAPADAEAMLAAIQRCPEVEEESLSDADRASVLEGLQTASELLVALGALDEQRRLTPLGRWGLPEALRRAWLS